MAQEKLQKFFFAYCKPEGQGTRDQESMIADYNLKLFLEGCNYGGLY